MCSLAKTRLMDIRFCKNLRSVRLENELTQKQVAQKLGVVESCYANWEQGRTEPNLEMLRKLSTLLHVKVDELLNDEI